MSKRVTYVALVTDHSGSMDYAEMPATAMYNAVLKTLKQEKGGGEVMVLPVEYDTRINPKAHITNPALKPVSRMRERSSWWWDGGTATFDAVGHAIEQLEGFDNIAANVAFLVVIITDGGENSSMRWGLDGRTRLGYPPSRDINAAVTEKQASGQWTFVFMSTDPDGRTYSSRGGDDVAMGIEPANAHYYPTFQEVSDAACAGIKSFMGERAAGRQAVDNFLQA